MKSANVLKDCLGKHINKNDSKYLISKDKESLCKGTLIIQFN